MRAPDFFSDSHVLHGRMVAKKYMSWGCVHNILSRSSIYGVMYLYYQCLPTCSYLVSVIMASSRK